MKQYNFVTKVISESSGKEYTIKMDDNGKLSCSCPSWIFNTRRNRTCKHIDVLIRAGFTADQTGKFISSTGNFGYSSLKYCTNYPEKCPSCELRFVCYTEAAPEFTELELKKAGIK